MKCKSTWNCEENPKLEVKKGTIVVLPYVWAHTRQGMTPHKDIEVEIDNDCTLLDALCRVEDAATEYVKSHGADDIRHYFIEGVEVGNNRIEFLILPVLWIPAQWKTGIRILKK